MTMTMTMHYLFFDANNEIHTCLHIMLELLLYFFDGCRVPGLLKY